MIFQKMFIHGKDRSGGASTVSSKIPSIEYNQIIQTKSSVEDIVALLNEAENLHSYRQMNSLGWKRCPHCEMIFLHYRKSNRKNCSRQCNGIDRGAEWATHGHKGRAGWTAESDASYKIKMSGANNPAWKGGVTFFKRKGKYANQSIKYVRCPRKFLAMARKDGYVMEHRLKVAKAIGRALVRAECVHHINHDATDNRLENLMLFKTNSDHKRYEHGQAIEPLWQP
ncbi:MAG: hypothetical protein GY755_21705 [Chloroflexi bacterium]|nr:hypothetical protein [Chloroflexota bacterium]